MTEGDAIKAAFAVAKAISAGQLSVADVEASAAAKAREVFGQVMGPGDPLWEVQVDVARQVLAVGGGVPVDELAEWVAVYRAAELDAAVVAPEPVPAGRGVSWIEAALAANLEDNDVDA